MKSDAPMYDGCGSRWVKFRGTGGQERASLARGSEAHVFSRAGPTFRTVTWYHEYPNWQNFYTQITLGHAKDLFLGKTKRS